MGNEGKKPHFLIPDIDETCHNYLQQEADILRRVGNHPNIVPLLGVTYDEGKRPLAAPRAARSRMQTPKSHYQRFCIYTDSVSLSLVLGYAQNGTLKTYLYSIRDAEERKGGDKLKFGIATQIARGMEYLVSRKVNSLSKGWINTLSRRGFLVYRAVHPRRSGGSKRSRIRRRRREIVRFRHVSISDER